MSKSVKLKNDTYLDISGISCDRKKLIDGISFYENDGTFYYQSTAKGFGEMFARVTKTLSSAGTEGSMHYTNTITIDLPSFFYYKPSINVTCEIQGAYGGYFVVSPSSTKNKIVGWLYTTLAISNKDVVFNIQCVGR